MNSKILYVVTSLKARSHWNGYEFDNIFNSRSETPKPCASLPVFNTLEEAKEYDPNAVIYELEYKKDIVNFMRATIFDNRYEIKITPNED